MRKRAKRERVFESLEGRQLLSAASVWSRFLPDAAELSSSAANNAAIVQTAEYPGTAHANALLTEREDFFATSTDATRWDWLADTQWYVPVENLLAYSAPSDLSDPVPIGDQTLWFIQESSDGYIAGQTIAKLSTNASPTQLSFEGVVTSGGQIRMEFAQNAQSPPTIGIGQMRFTNGQWYMQMQMGTGITDVVTHWAYMAQYDDNFTPPDASDPFVDTDLLSQEWRWLEGTNWAITDKNLFGKAKSGVFTIDEYHNGYFWGSGNSKQPFNVLGSVTPEGNLFLLVSVNGRSPVSRTGILQEIASGGMMTLRTYEGNPAIGFAWTIDVQSGVSGAIATYTNTVLSVIRSESPNFGTTTKQIRELTKELQREIANVVKQNAASQLPSQSADQSRSVPISKGKVPASHLDAVVPALPNQLPRLRFATRG